jgi:D-hexose-6-phosphate mutarotase
MGELIRIGAPEGDSRLGFTVDPIGAYVTSFGFGERKVLEDRFVNDVGRYRGGLPLCAPWFGQAKDPAHGPARGALWTPVNSRTPLMNSRVGRPEMGLILEWMADVGSGCEGLRHTLELSLLNRRSLRAELAIKNEDGERIEVIAPGFHPYFKVDDQTTDDQIRSVYAPTEPGQAIATSKFDKEAELRGEEPTHKQKIVLGQNTTYVESNLMTAVIWTDDPKRYVCYEPTQTGGSLDVADGAILLKRGEERRFFINITTSAIEERSARLA